MASTAYQHLAARQSKLADALDANPDVAKFVLGVLEHLIDRAEARGQDPADLDVDTVEIRRIGHSTIVSARIR